MTIGLRVSQEEEDDGIDASFHKESLESNEVIIQRQVARRDSSIIDLKSLIATKNEDDNIVINKEV